MKTFRPEEPSIQKRAIDFFFRVAELINCIVNKIIKSTEPLTCGLLVLLVSITFSDVIMRYVFNSGSVGLQELEWHLFSAIFLLGGAITLREDKHVRVDLIYRSKLLKKRHRAFVDICGILFFLLPFCTVIIITSAPFVYDAYYHDEISPDAGGLPHRWIIKLTLPLGFILIVLQGFVSLKQNLLTIIKNS